MVCYCKQPIRDDARHLRVTLNVDWGQDDLREPAEPKTYEFHSFACIGQWAADRAAQHDTVTVREGQAEKGDA